MMLEHRHIPMVMTMMATTAAMATTATMAMMATMAMTAMTAVQDKAPMVVTEILPMAVTSLLDRFHQSILRMRGMTACGIGMTSMLKEQKMLMNLQLWNPS
jgi:uncharacterized protein YmfQ (DUF2313 family)